MRSRKFPTAQTILLVISAMAAIATWFIPAGQYAMLSYDDSKDQFQVVTQEEVRVLPVTQETLDELGIKIPLENFRSGAIYKPIGIPYTYRQVDADPQGVFEYVQAPVKGLIETANIIFLLLIIGGLIGVISYSGAFNAGIAALAEVLKGREFILIVATTLLVGLGGTTFGLAEETIAFLPILIPVFLAARYDAIVAVASVFLGSSVGSMCSTVNPFSIIIASETAGIDWTTGLGGRILMFFICFTVTIIFLLNYARKVKADPRRSFLYGSGNKINPLLRVPADPDKIPRLTSRLKIILLIFSACFLLMIIGVSRLDWWFEEMASTFLVGAILIGFIARIPEGKFVEVFIKGAGELLGVSVIIGLARGITILMSDGMISDTILFHASEFVQTMGKGLFINSIFMVYNGLTLFIASSSGTAVLTMPIMAPLADSVGIGREMIINAYVFGNGLCGIISPIGMVLPTLAIANIGYDRWLKFIWPLLIILGLICMIFLSISVYL